MMRWKEDKRGGFTTKKENLFRKKVQNEFTEKLEKNEIKEVEDFDNHYEMFFEDPE